MMTSVNMAVPDRPAIAAVRLKVDRAFAQAQSLADAEHAWVDLDPSPYLIKRRVKEDFTEHVYYISLEVQIPLDFSILLGEIIYNLRSALDQCVFQLSIDNTGVEHEQTMFPIFTSPEAFRRNGAQRIRTLGEGPRALIESLQPYDDRSQRIHRSLLDLNNLSNADKHRVSHLWGLSFSTEGLEIAAGATLFPTGLGKVLHHGEEICRVFPQYPTDQKLLEGSLRTSLSVENPTAARRGFSTSLWDIIADTRTLVEALLGTLGFQTEPVDVRWPDDEPSDEE